MSRDGCHENEEQPAACLRVALFHCPRQVAARKPRQMAAEGMVQLPVAKGTNSGQFTFCVIPVSAVV